MESNNKALLGTLIATLLLWVCALLLWSRTLFYIGAILYTSFVILFILRGIKMFSSRSRVPPTPNFSSSSGKGPPREIFPIGPYKLDTTIDALTGLVEFSAAEYTALDRSLDTGKVFKAPPVTFCGFQWDINIGVVEGRIYKIAAFMHSDDTGAALKAHAAVNDFCFRHLGQHSDLTERFAIWDLPNGNVILERPNPVPAGLWPGASGCYVNLFLTSRLVLKAIGVQGRFR